MYKTHILLVNLTETVDFFMSVMLQYAYKNMNAFLDSSCEYVYFTKIGHKKHGKEWKMELLAIKDGKGKGVYICNNEEEKNT